MASTSTDYSLATISTKKEPGSAQKAEGINLLSFSTAVGSASIIFVIQLSAFLFLRNRIPQTYQPKTQSISGRRHIDAPPRGIFQLLTKLWSINDAQIIQECGLDAYFFLRYLKTLIVILLPVVLIVLPVLTPLNFIGGRSQQLLAANNTLQVTGLDTLAWGNVAPQHTDRYIVHLLMAILVVAWTCTVFFFELRKYIKVRQDYLTQASHQKKVSATTILVSSIPTKWLSNDALRELFDVFPGGVKNIWLNRNLTELLDKITYRDQIHLKLESAETSLIRAVKKAQIRQIEAKENRRHGQLDNQPSPKEQKAARQAYEDRQARELAEKPEPSIYDSEKNMQRLKPSHGAASPEVQCYSNVGTPPHASATTYRDDNTCPSQRTKRWQFWRASMGSPTCHGSQSAGKRQWFRTEHNRKKWGPGDHEETDFAKFDVNALWREYVDQAVRPMHHLPLFGIQWLPGLPILSRKVDTIWWCRKQLDRLNAEIEVDQNHPARFPLMNSAFVQFHSQLAAHMACQTEIYHLPQYMAPRTLEISHHDVIWSNISLNWPMEWARMAFVIAAVSIMVFLWAIPVAWTAILGQLGQIASNTRSVANNKAALKIISMVSGVLPAIVLSLLLVLVPLVLDVLAKWKGVKTGAQRSEFVQTFYFCFLFVQLFLVVSITSFFASSLDQLLDNVRRLRHASDVMDLLAINLPKASNYFFSYIILQGLSLSSSTLFRGTNLIMQYVFAPILDNTPRSRWSRKLKLDDIRWGSFFPVYTNLACICLIYSIIAPLISIFGVISFLMLWFAQKYSVLYIMQFNHDTQGILYPRAINQTFTGLYVMELCLAGLFFITQDEDAKRTCIGHGVVMILALVMTVVYQLLLNWSFGPLFRYLPITTESKTASQEQAFKRARRLYSLGRNTNTDAETEFQSYVGKGMEIASHGYNGDETSHPSIGCQDLTFEHVALHAPRPVLWIPRDNLGISDDEIHSIQSSCKHICVSNAGTALDSKADVIIGRDPPDYLPTNKMSL
ncbi:hypothetical protein BGZ63DRAFT_379416, partial [Mariannaea sp. PMI_226]